MDKKKIIIIGGGSAALFVSTLIDMNRYEVHLYEQKSTLGRKFLVAGYGGLNLSFEEDSEQMIERYTPSGFMHPFISRFDKNNFVSWLEKIGVKTFVGTSRRIFPVKKWKPIDVLNKILKRIETRGVLVNTNCRWDRFESVNSTTQLVFEKEGEEVVVQGDYYIWALGGASWQKTGSDGKWKDKFSRKGIGTLQFQASNCAFGVKWEDSFISNYNGSNLKNISLSCGDATKSGELTISRFGFEGNAIYPLSPMIREQLNQNGQTTVLLDLKPMFTIEQVLEKLLSIPSSMAISKGLQVHLKLSKPMIALLKLYTSKTCFQDLSLLAEKVKALPIQISDIGPLDEAISSVGGIALSEVEKDLSLKSLPNHYVIGEMVDWDAPTGGFLIQGCYSMAAYLADELNKK